MDMFTSDSDCRTGICIGLPSCSYSQSNIRDRFGKCLLPSVDSVGSSTSSMRFLIVDDVSLSRKMIVRRLEVSRIVCDQASDGDEAIVKLMEASKRNIIYNAIIIDNKMNYLNGTTAAKMMRVFGYNRPIFGITGNAADQDLAQFQSFGLNSVFIKPLCSDDYTDMITGKSCVCFIFNSSKLIYFMYIFNAYRSYWLI
jgi:CheY-like chemotaxis protein